VLGASQARLPRRLEEHRFPIARDALEQIGKLYDVERAINGQPLERRLAARQQQSRPRVLAFRAWCEQQLGPHPRQGRPRQGHALRPRPLGPSFTLFLDDARVAIDNNAAERAIRPISIGRKNFLFAGADAGGEILADAMTVIETAKLSGLNPEAYLADILARIRDHDPAKLDDLLPWNWRLGIFDLLGVVGAMLYVGNYTRLALGRASTADTGYFVVNLLAASLVLIGLSHAFNLGAALIQLFFVVLSFVAVINRWQPLRRLRRLRRRHRPTAPESQPIRWTRPRLAAKQRRA
jgi:hypothetical protein